MGAFTLSLVLLQPSCHAQVLDEGPWGQGEERQTHTHTHVHVRYPR